MWGKQGDKREALSIHDKLIDFFLGCWCCTVGNLRYKNFLSWVHFFFLLLLSSILTLYLLQMHLKFFVLFIRGLYCESERANGFNRNDKCKNHKKRFATGLRARILSCKWLSIDWKDDVRIVGSSPCSKLAPVLASFSADLASELRKLVAIKVGCKWPLKVYVAREKNHFL